MKPIIFLAFANDRIDDARYLRNLPLELRSIRSALQPAIDSNQCELIERANCTIEEVFDVFQKNKDRIVVFHYGGHADGYQLLLETPDGDHEIAYAGGLVTFFSQQKSLQLVFLNGCATRQQSQELAEIGVPVVIGTNSSIKDNVAVEVATQFYKSLGLNFSIQQAWATAKAFIMTKNGSDERGLKLRRDKDHNQPPWELFKSKNDTDLWQLNQERTYLRKNIFKVMMAMFNDEDLQTFCMFNFEETYNNFASGQSKQQRILALFDHCIRFVKIEKLLALLEEENTKMFEKFKPYSQ